MAYKNNLSKFTKPAIPVISQEYINRRIEINNMIYFNKLCHPFFDKVWSFKLREEHCEVKDVCNGIVYYVNDENKMRFMCSHLLRQKEIAVDTEFDNIHFYREVIALIQISSYEYDFIIDPFVVYPFMKSMLEPIFLNENILKLVFSENDIPRFQRDFNIFFVGVLDFQAVQKDRLGTEQRQSLSVVVKDLLNVDMRKDYQNFYWITRPLPQEALDYARQDSRILLNCWNKIKTQCDVKWVELEDSKVVCSTLFTFPKNKNSPISDYTYLISKCKDANIGNKYDIYTKIWNWRNDVAKNIDRNVKDLITINQIIQLLQIQNYDFIMLKNVLSKFKDSDIEKLCKSLTGRDDRVMDWSISEGNYDVIKVLEGDPNVEVPLGGSVEFMEVEEETGVSVGSLGLSGVTVGSLGGKEQGHASEISDVSFEKLVISESPDPLEVKRQKKIRNFKSKQNWKQKFKLENEERLKRGELALKRPYGKGAAWKKKGAFRKHIGLQVGPTTFTKKR